MFFIFLFISWRLAGLFFIPSFAWSMPRDHGRHYILQPGLNFMTDFIDTFLSQLSLACKEWKMKSKLRDDEYAFLFCIHPTHIHITFLYAYLYILYIYASHKNVKYEPTDYIHTILVSLVPGTHKAWLINKVSNPIKQVFWPDRLMKLVWKASRFISLENNVYFTTQLFLRLIDK